MVSSVKQEPVELSEKLQEKKHSPEIISINSSSSSSNNDFSGFSSDELDVEFNPKKKQRIAAVLPVGFLDPIRPEERMDLEKPNRVWSNAMAEVKELENAKKEEEKETAVTTVVARRNCKQFWKAGDYEGCFSGGGSGSDVSFAQMDHVRVHPRFLHSNATSHKWALGAFAELLDNALDEVCNGATYVSVDIVMNIKDTTKMVVVQDNGGGMTPDKMRQCMSLGYSAKSKMANTIGQYGNGFKTSTMRLGADVIVFSRCCQGNNTTQSIGMLSYTFLQNTGKEDIMVPMIDYEKMGESWSKCVKSSSACWQANLETIVQWSPYVSEEDLLHQFNFLGEQGTRIVIYNLWEDEQGLLELDFTGDKHDIQIRGGNIDKKKIEMANMHSSCRKFLTYRHSLRSYTSILYRRFPPGFRIILRGKEVDHHNIVDDLIHTQEHVYKPAACASSKDPNMSAAVTLGFIKDAVHHIDIQGFNVYHKNRLIKPFWRVWNAAGSDGRGVIGVLEANFVEPAHDKQGFERTTALSRLEARLVHLQKTYWSTNCHLIGYAQRRHASKKSVSALKEEEAPAAASPDDDNSNSKHNTDDNMSSSCVKWNIKKMHKSPAVTATEIPRRSSHARNQNFASYPPSYVEPLSEYQPQEAHANVPLKTEGTNNGAGTFLKLKEENNILRNSLNNARNELQYEKNKNKSLEDQLQNTTQMLQRMDQEQEMFITTFSEERSRRDDEEHNLRRRLKEASETIDGLLRKVKMLEASSASR